jgi:asparagine synthase (glutamine-hydrolysing)
MCGIAGLVRAGGARAQDLRGVVQAMNTAIIHRGPDGEGVWLDADAGVALAQRRLAIVDLSPTGAQPMVSHSGRYVLTYNGEIYNFREMRAALEAEGAVFAGSSDTEVMLASLERHGVTQTLATLNGMYAFALWDRETRELVLARDPFGIKPLLYHASSAGLSFASELGALLADPACPRAIDRAAVNAFIRHGNVPAPWTLLAGVRKLEPGTTLSWRAGTEPVLTRFWSPLDSARTGAAAPHTAPWETLVGEGEALLSDAVERQMIADVPLGAFLSGGIDSSLVVALMQRASSRPVQTFTIGFDDAAYDESAHASAIATHLRTDHHTLNATSTDALNLVEEMAGVYDEPFADSSQLPTLLLAKLVRGHVTVALSGDGGDESFGGYERYGWGLQLAGYQRRVPATARRMAGAAARNMPLTLMDVAARLTGMGASAHPGHRLQRALVLGAAPDFVSGYRQLLALHSAPHSLTGFAGEHHPAAYDPPLTANIADPLTRMQVIDALSYMPDDILTKVDRASMAVALEVRVPLLDTRIWEWAMRLPPESRRHKGTGKAMLRAILARHVPPALFERPKAGFAVPLAAWLRGPLRPWAESLLAPAALADGGLVDPAAAQKLWQTHLAGRADHGPVLWSLLMLEGWRKKHRLSTGPSHG